MQRAPKEAAARPLVIAIICYALFLLLGVYVSHRTPGVIDLWSRALVRHGDLTAWVLTWTVYAPWLVPVCLGLAALALVQPQWRARVVLSLSLLVVMWGASDLFQHVFMRMRPTDWIVKHETAYSYPSTHATLAIAFYGLWAFLVWRSELAQRWRVAISSALCALIVAILWARLELGAHHPTDLAGGILLGLAGINVALAICAFFEVRLSP